MENNDVLRMFRYALNITDATMLNIFKIAGCRIDNPQLVNILKKRDDQGYVACSTTLLEKFFDGLITYNRSGKDEDSSSLSSDSERETFVAKKAVNREKRSNSEPPKKEINIDQPPESLSNNVILKKIRIALDLKQEDMMELFKLGKVNIAKGEFTALFRKKGHKHYKECGDQYLKKFLQGLAIRHRS